MSQSEIYVIFGKRGSGKSNLTKRFLEELGGRVIYISMIDDLQVCDLELYTFEDIDKIADMREGQIAVCKNYSYEMFSYLCSAMIVNKNYRSIQTIYYPSVPIAALILILIVLTLPLG